MAGLSKDAELERLVLSGGPLRIDEVVGVARGRVAVEFGDAGRKRMGAAREVVERVVAEGRRAYGVSTGFGLLANTPIAPADLRELQRRIVLSHATGSGDPLDGEVVRAMQLLRARTLVQGYSGVRPVVVEALLALLTAGVMPLIPEHGSVGASGDLAQLAHLALPLIGEGEVEVDGERMPASEGLRRAGIEPLDLSYKEGLSLVNGTEGMLALACLAVTDAVALASMADVACAMWVDRLLDPALNHDLPPFLARDPGLNSGLMLTQYTAAALVSECKVLAHPASVDSIPTSGNQEDHVSMGWTAGLKLRRVLANVRRTIAIEALCAAQAVDMRSPLRPGRAVAAVMERLRRDVPRLEHDRYLAPDMAAVERLVANGELVAAAESVVGTLA